MQPACRNGVWPSRVFQGWVNWVPMAVAVCRDLLLCIWCLPCQLGFCMHLIFSQYPKQPALPPWQWTFGWGCFSFPSLGSRGSQGLLLAFWLPTMPPCEVLLCTDSRILSQTFSVCLSCLWEKQHQEMRLLQGTTISLSLRLGNWYGQSLKVKWSQPKWPQAVVMVAVLCLQHLAARQLHGLGTHLLSSSSWRGDLLSFTACLCSTVLGRWNDGAEELIHSQGSQP